MKADEPARQDIFELYTDEDLAAAAALLEDAIKVQVVPVLQQQLDALRAQIARRAGGP